MRVLVVLLGSIGDVVRGLPVATHLKTAQPESHITWLVEPAAAPIVKAVRAIDEVVVFDRPRGMSAVWKIFQELRRRHFDCVFDLQRHFKSGLFSIMSGAPLRFGFHRRNTKEGNHLFNNRFIPPASEEHVTKFEQYLQFLRAVGIEAPLTPDFGLRGLPLPVSLRETCVARGSFIALVVGSRWKSKDWLSVGYQGLIKKILNDTAWDVVLLGTKDRSADSQSIVAGFPEERIANLVGATTLLDLCPIFERARAVVGPDSGPAHLAAAVGAPHITLFGPTRPQRTAPLGSEHLSVQATLGCVPCYRKTCPGLNNLCMRLISADAVFAKLQGSVLRS